MNNKVVSSLLIAIIISIGIVVPLAIYDCPIIKARMEQQYTIKQYSVNGELINKYEHVTRVVDKCGELIFYTSEGNKVTMPSNNVVREEEGVN